MNRNRLLILGLIAAAAAILIACGISTVVGGTNSVEGQVISVEQQSITRIASLTLEDASGKQWVFQGSGTFAGFTASHLREHGALGEPVTVEYEEADSGELTILEISD
jgi:hypothetical protein